VSLRDLGLNRLRDLPHPIHVFQLVHPGLAPEMLAADELPGGSKLTAQPLARFKPIELMDVPTLPAIVVQALKLMQDSDSDARSVERVIARDRTLSVKILRVANSAFFGHARQVSTIADAIRILGFTHVQGMFIGIGAVDAFRTERLDLGGFWRHSIATATAARWLAPARGGPGRRGLHRRHPARHRQAHLRDPGRRRLPARARARARGGRHRAAGRAHPARVHLPRGG
jgi:hypothetical protein